MRQLYALLSPPFSLSSMYLHFFYSSPFTSTSEVGLASPTKWLPPAASLDDTWGVAQGSGASGDYV
ncbi:hypothetical protein BGY98DRAFT_1040108, partial [Russula aff. rugulosa BPL654]